MAKSAKRKSVEVKFQDEEVENLENLNPEKKKKKTDKADFECSEEADCGILEKIVLSNFMCHTKLEVKLGHNVNFVIGRNGSGKSAILTAIIVGLGGKANITSRGSSLKGFIKEGCTACSIVTTLRNKGTDAFKPESYGEKITIERRITVDGTSSYKLKSADGHVVTNKKDELVSMLDQFNIQIDNPVSILTQDTSRSFLNTSNERDKYTFFLKATQLEQMSCDYQLIQMEKEQLKETLKRKKEVLPELHQKVKLYEEKYNDMVQLKDMKNKIAQLKKELAWAMVRDKQYGVEEATEAPKKYQAKSAGYEKQIIQCEETITEITKMHKQKQTEMNEYTEEINVLIHQKSELEKTFKTAKHDVRKAENTVKNIEKSMQKLETDKQHLLDEIERIRNTAQRDLETERKQREDAVAEKQQELSLVQSGGSELKQQYKQLRHTIEAEDQRKHSLMNEIKESDRSIQAKRKELQQIEENKRNRLLAFGRSTPQIIKAVEEARRAGRFRKKPVGPLGSLIKLRDHAWVLAVEKCVDGLMCSYACDNGDDMQVLKEIFQRNCGRQQRIPAIIVSTFSECRYDTRQNAPQPATYPSVLDMLEFENNVVANTMIDQARIESIILIKEASEARNVIWSNRIRNTSKALSMEGHEILGGRSSKFYPNKAKRPKYLQKDVDAMLRNTEQELLEVQRAKKALADQLAQVNSDIKNKRSDQEMLHRKLQHNESALNNIQMEIAELQNYEEEKIPDVSDLGNEVTDINNSLEKLKENLSSVQEDLEEKSLHANEQSGKQKDIAERCQKATETYESMQTSLNSTEADLITAKSDRQHYQTRLAEVSQVIKELDKNHLELEADYEDAREKALKFCGEEINTRKKTESLESEIIKSTKRIEREEARRGNADEITDKYKHALARFEETKNLIEQHIRFRKSLDRAIQRRSERYEKFRKYITDRSRYHFRMLLSQRGYDGNIRLDHAEETLNIQVNVENKKGASTKDSKSLSGGERSFSTICFIMALWDAMEAPFRCLDEFDVFMDMLNRRISMKMLMDIAKETTFRQFILLTPQDMSNIQQSKNVKIFRLNDPDREAGQQRIPFQPAAEE